MFGKSGDLGGQAAILSAGYKIGTGDLATSSPAVHTVSIGTAQHSLFTHRLSASSCVNLFS